MTKVELGTKRLCPNCGARYYDLNRSPIICPRCGTQFEVIGARPRPQTVSKAPKPAVQEEAEEEATVEVVSLEEADEEAADTGAIGALPDEEEDEEVEADEDDTFLADEEEDEEDVGDIIGDVDEEDT